MNCGLQPQLGPAAASCLLALQQCLLHCLATCNLVLPPSLRACPLMLCTDFRCYKQGQAWAAVLPGPAAEWHQGCDSRESTPLTSMPSRPTSKAASSAASTKPPPAAAGGLSAWAPLPAAASPLPPAAAPARS